MADGALTAKEIKAKVDAVMQEDIAKRDGPLKADLALKRKLETQWEKTPGNEWEYQRGNPYSNDAASSDKQLQARQRENKEATKLAENIILNTHITNKEMVDGLASKVGDVYKEGGLAGLHEVANTLGVSEHELQSPGAGGKKPVNQNIGLPGHK